MAEVDSDLTGEKLSRVELERSRSGFGGEDHPPFDVNDQYDFNRRSSQSPNQLVETELTIGISDEKRSRLLRQRVPDVPSSYPRCWHNM